MSRGIAQGSKAGLVTAAGVSTGLLGHTAFATFGLGALLRAANGISNEEKIDAIVKSLAARGQARPRKVGTLSNTINALFMKTLDEAEVASLVKQLQKRKLIEVVDDKVSYRPPISQP